MTSIIFSIFSDIDECESEDFYCEQICTNSDGSYTCSCRDGYILNDDDETCEGLYIKTMGRYLSDIYSSFCIYDPHLAS